VDVYVAGLEQVGIDAVFRGVAAHPRQRGLHRLLHDGAQLAVMIRPLLPPGMRPASMNRTSPPTGVHAKPRHTGAARAVGHFVSVR